MSNAISVDMKAGSTVGPRERLVGVLSQAQIRRLPKSLIDNRVLFSLKGVLTLLRANGLDDYVDQYGVHSYILWAGNSASNIHHLNFSAHYGVRHQARRRKGVGHAGRGRLPRQRCGPPDPVQSLAG